MKIIVVGCGRLGAELAYRLSKAGHSVSVFDSNVSAFDKLPADFIGRTHEGSGLQQDVLSRAGIETADGLAAVTESDAINTVIARIAGEKYHIKNVVAQNYDPLLRLLYEDLGIQVISPESWGVQRVEELLYDEDFYSVFSAGNGEVEIYEIKVPETWEGKKLADLMTEGGCVPIAVTRGGRATMPDPQTVLAAEDVIHFSATFEGINHLRSRVENGEGC
jgi:trk system potassium uptake protein TrkA